MTTNGKAHHRARVVVVGAGPAGSAAALRLVQNGIDDVVLVDAHDFPRHKTCGSALSPRGVQVVKELGVWDRIEPIAYPIHGIRVVTPGGQEAWLEAPGRETQAVVCLRHDMDYEIHKAALARGVRFLPHFKASAPILAGERWAGIRAADGRNVEADWVVVANGTHSKFAIDDSPKQMIHTIMGWWTGVEFRPGFIEMIFDELVMPLYGWLFPETEERVNIGITYPDDDKSKNARELFQRFLDRFYGDRLRGATQVGALKGHPILYTYKIGRLATPGRIVVGEAGRMTHPATGEGIYHGMRSGSWAADALRDILIRHIPEAVATRVYETKCRAAFSPSFWAGGLFRGLVRTPMLDWAVGFSRRPRVQETVRRVLAHM